MPRYKLKFRDFVYLQGYLEIEANDLNEVKYKGNELIKTGEVFKCVDDWDDDGDGVMLVDITEIS